MLVHAFFHTSKKWKQQQQNWSCIAMLVGTTTGTYSLCACGYTLYPTVGTPSPPLTIHLWNLAILTSRTIKILATELVRKENAHIFVPDNWERVVAEGRRKKCVPCQQDGDRNQCIRLKTVKFKCSVRGQLVQSSTEVFPLAYSFHTCFVVMSKNFSTTTEFMCGAVWLLAGFWNLLHSINFNWLQVNFYHVWVSPLWFGALPIKNVNTGYSDTAYIVPCPNRTVNCCAN